jgi:hypothetical protein
MVKAPSVLFALLLIVPSAARGDEPRTGEPKLQRDSSRVAVPATSPPTISQIGGRDRSANAIPTTAASAPQKKVRVTKEDGAAQNSEGEIDGGVAGLSNNACASATAISGAGPFNFNSGLAGMTQDGPNNHPACSFNGQTGIDKDEWFCWTAPPAPCGGEFVLSTCTAGAVDTKVAIYQGCSCPVDNARLLECSDDDCGVQTMIPFNPTPGQQYLIRVGVFPGATGGAGTFSMTCHANTLPCQQSSDNCQVPSQVDGVNSNGADFIVADDFRPTTSGNINSLCFWGAYLDDVSGDDCSGPAVDNFVIRYYSSVNGRPGSLLATYSQEAGTLNVTGPEPTGLTISTSVITEYEFSATHAALPVTANTCYWIEITNEIEGCSWFWELGNVQNDRAFQDGRSGVAPDGYDPEETLVADMAFCIGRVLGDSVGCWPPVPANNNCANAQPISTEADILYDLSSATQDGPAHGACLAFGQTQISHDVWYCWTSPCTETAFVRTCADTVVDTKIAVYDGCTCPPAEADLLTCVDDFCGADGVQTMVTFEAVQGQSYLIRLGTYPLVSGASGIMRISCGPPDNPACPASGSCCDPQPESGGCGNETCCETVCACDPFCCELEWDIGCATTGFAGSGCGADALCGCGATCGSPSAGDCCSGHDNPACDDATCCETVCECDSFCCDTEWDEFCAGNGSIPGCGAAVLCTEHCAANCPVGPIQWLSPPNNVTDARRPTTRETPPVQEGISQIFASGPAGADENCWTFCETGVVGQSNFITSVEENAGVYTINLDRPISRGFVTRITYTDNNSTATSARFFYHPANVNNNTVSDSGDVLLLYLHLNAGQSLPWGLFSGDSDRSGVITGLDLLTLIDLLNGADPFDSWLNTQKPAAAPVCP